MRLKKFNKENKFEMKKKNRDVHLYLDEGLMNLSQRAMDKLNQGFMGVTRTNFLRMAIKIYSELILAGKVKIDLTVEENTQEEKG